MSSSALEQEARVKTSIKTVRITSERESILLAALFLIFVI